MQATQPATQHKGDLVLSSADLSQRSHLISKLVLSQRQNGLAEQPTEKKLLGCPSKTHASDIAVNKLTTQVQDQARVQNIIYQWSQTMANKTKSCNRENFKAMQTIRRKNARQELYESVSSADLDQQQQKNRRHHLTAERCTFSGREKHSKPSTATDRHITRRATPCTQPPHGGAFYKVSGLHQQSNVLHHRDQKPNHPLSPSLGAFDSHQARRFRRQSTTGNYVRVGTTAMAENRLKTMLVANNMKMNRKVLQSLSTSNGAKRNSCFDIINLINTTKIGASDDPAVGVDLRQNRRRRPKTNEAKSRKQWRRIIAQEFNCQKQTQEQVGSYETPARRFSTYITDAQPQCSTYIDQTEQSLNQENSKSTATPYLRAKNTKQVINMPSGDVEVTDNYRSKTTIQQIETQKSINSQEKLRLSKLDAKSSRKSHPTSPLQASASGSPATTSKPQTTEYTKQNQPTEPPNNDLDTLKGQIRKISTLFLPDPCKGGGGATSRSLGKASSRQAVNIFNSGYLCGLDSASNSYANNDLVNSTGNFQEKSFNAAAAASRIKLKTVQQKRKKSRDAQISQGAQTSKISELNHDGEDTIQRMGTVKLPVRKETNATSSCQTTPLASLGQYRIGTTKISAVPSKIKRLRRNAESTGRLSMTQEGTQSPSKQQVAKQGGILQRRGERQSGVQTSPAGQYDLQQLSSYGDCLDLPSQFSKLMHISKGLILSLKRDQRMFKKLEKSPRSRLPKRKQQPTLTNNESVQIDLLCNPLPQKIAMPVTEFNFKTKQMVQVSSDFSSRDVKFRNQTVPEGQLTPSFARQSARQRQLNRHQHNNKDSARRMQESFTQVLDLQNALNRLRSDPSFSLKTSQYQQDSARTNEPVKGPNDHLHLASANSSQNSFDLMRQLRQESDPRKPSTPAVPLGAISSAPDDVSSALCGPPASGVLLDARYSSENISQRAGHSLKLTLAAKSQFFEAAANGQQQKQSAELSIFKNIYNSETKQGPMATNIADRTENQCGDRLCSSVDQAAIQSKVDCSGNLVTPILGRNSDNVVLVSNKTPAEFLESFTKAISGVSPSRDGQQLSERLAVVAVYQHTESSVSQRQSDRQSDAGRPSHIHTNNTQRRNFKRQRHNK